MPTLMTSRMLHDDLAFVEEQLRKYSDPYDTVRLMWERRRNALQQEIESLEAQHDSRAEVALLFSGNPVRGSEEIRLDFATRVLENYQQVVATLVAERAGTGLRSRGRLPQSFNSRLFIRDMVRGSVGFLLEEADSSQSTLLPSMLQEAVEETTHALEDLSSPDLERFNSRLAQLSPRVVNAIKKMAKILLDAEAETNIVSNQMEVKLDLPSTASLNTRLAEIEIAEKREMIPGRLLGAFPERQQYEFAPTEGPVFYGPVSEALDARYLADPRFVESILLKPAIATFLVISTVRARNVEKQERVLEAIEPVATATRITGPRT
jgi:hypothetical protein